MKKVKKSSISKSTNILEMGEFWDTHDVSDFSSKTYPVKFDVELKTKKEYIALLPDIINKLSKYAHTYGVKIESLVNTWLQQKIDTLSRKTR